MLHSRLLQRLFKQPASRLTDIYISAAAGEPVTRVTTIQAVANQGLQGDRYCQHTGYWQSIEACQVTLLTEHDLEQAIKSAPAAIADSLLAGGHRRNLVISGLRSSQLEGRTFRIGSAVFSYEKPRPPCGYLDKIQGKGFCKAINHHSGICIKVVTGGCLSTGDPVVLEAV